MARRGAPGAALVVLAALAAGGLLGAARASAPRADPPAPPPDTPPAAPSAGPEAAAPPGSKSIPPPGPARAGGPQMLRMFLETRANPDLPVYVYAAGDAGRSEGESGAPAVILFSSGFGWTPILQETAGRMVERGHPVLGVETPEYFKAEVADAALRADLAAMRAFINGKAGRPADTPVLLSGFSYGAEMVPYFINRAGVDGVKGLLLIAPDARGATVFRASIILKMDSPSAENFAVVQELARMPPLPTILIQGGNDPDAAGQSFIPVLRGPKRLVVVPGATHQFREVRGAYLLQVDQALRWIDAMASQAATGTAPQEGPPPALRPAPDDPEPRPRP